MKKVLLAGTALVGFAAFAAPAHAELKLDLGGYFSGYGVWSDNNERVFAGTAGGTGEELDHFTGAGGGALLSSAREFDLRRDSEVYVSGETTLDNGLTVGFHTEQALGNSAAPGTVTDEAYAYFSGSWGRVNLGSEDGAAYLLQTAAPGADSNTDGLRTYMKSFAPVTNQTILYRSVGTGANAYGTQALVFSALDSSFGGGDQLDYDHISDPTAANTDRITYLTPKFSGFQGGLSFAPEQGQNTVGNNIANPTANNDVAASFAALAANSTGATVAAANAVTAASAGATQYEDIWEAAVRWDGEFEGFGLSVGGGYSQADIEAPAAVATVAADATAGEVANGAFGVVDGTETWNVGAGATWNGFSLGANYLQTSVGVAGTVENAADAVARLTGDVERKTWVLGMAWDNGPYHLGASYLNQETELPRLSNMTAAVASGDQFFNGATHEADKATIGGGYTFGPGMTFRGSVSWGDFEAGGTANTTAAPVAAPDNSFTQVAIGTQIDF
jgi:outer membrane protein OmpU